MISFIRIYRIHVLQVAGCIYWTSHDFFSPPWPSFFLMSWASPASSSFIPMLLLSLYQKLVQKCTLFIQWNQKIQALQRWSRFASRIHRKSVSLIPADIPKKISHILVDIALLNLYLALCHLRVQIKGKLIYHDYVLPREEPLLQPMPKFSSAK